MSERKVLNKYYPPDFDPSKIPKLKLPRDRQYVVRLMAPFSMRCTKCGEYIYKGRKFNAKKETILDKDYLGIKMYRFYIKCTKCGEPIAFRTDPETTDYIVELGATRNFQAERLAKLAEEEDQRLRAQEEADNPMISLERRTEDSKREIDILDALEEIRDQNARLEQVNVDAVIQTYQNSKTEEVLSKETQEAEDDRLAKSIFSTNVKKLCYPDECSDAVTNYSNTTQSFKKERKTANIISKYIKLNNTTTTTTITNTTNNNNSNSNNNDNSSSSSGSNRSSNGNNIVNNCMNLVSGYSSDSDNSDAETND